MGRSEVVDTDRVHLIDALQLVFGELQNMRLEKDRLMCLLRYVSAFS